MNNMAEFARRLKAQREKTGMTQAQLAEKVGVTAQTISAYEKNNGEDKGKTPTLDKAIALSLALNVSLSALCGIEKEDKPATIENLAGAVIRIEEILDVFDYYMDFEDEMLASECDGFSREKTTVIRIEDNCLAEYYIKREKMRALLRDGTIDKVLFNSWMSGEMMQIKKCPRYVSDVNDSEWSRGRKGFMPAPMFEDLDD